MRIQFKYFFYLTFIITSFLTCNAQAGWFKKKKDKDTRVINVTIKGPGSERDNKYRKIPVDLTKDNKNNKKKKNPIKKKDTRVINVTIKGPGSQRDNKYRKIPVDLTKDNKNKDHNYIKLTQ